MATISIRLDDDSRSNHVQIARLLLDGDTFAEMMDAFAAFVIAAGMAGDERFVELQDLWDDIQADDAAEGVNFAGDHETVMMAEEDPYGTCGFGIVDPGHSHSINAPHDYVHTHGIPEPLKDNGKWQMPEDAIIKPYPAIFQVGDIVKVIRDNDQDSKFVLNKIGKITASFTEVPDVWLVHFSEGFEARGERRTDWACDSDVLEFLYRPSASESKRLAEASNGDCLL